MKEKITFEDSKKAAYLEFKEEPMDKNYSNLIAGYPSRLRVKKILQRLGKIKGKSILDAGCEAGHISIKLLERGAKVTAVDIVEPALEAFKEKIKGTNYNPKIIKASIQELPFEDNTFDSTICTETLEHVPDVKKCLSELNRVTKQSGTIIITIPIEKTRKLLYPIARLFGINTSVESQVTLHDVSIQEITKIAKDLDFCLQLTKKFPIFFPLTYMITLIKPMGLTQKEKEELDI